MSLLNRTISLLLLTLLSLRVLSQLPASLDTLKTNTVLYRVSHPNHDKVSYLFGTHHAFGKPFFDSLKNATEALESSTLLIKENLNIPGQLAEDYINQRTSTTKWSRYLNKDDLLYVESLFAPTGLNFHKMTPAELNAFLSRRYKEQVCIGKDTAATYFSLDDYIATVAEEHQIPLVGLETTEEQIRLINEDVKGMPRKIHKKRLSRMVARLQSGSTDHCEEISWYHNMNFDFKLKEPCRNTLILANRNDTWMLELQRYLKTENCFVVVGLSHLMFECGLISQLYELGYNITPIPVK